jgi:hypothetical protein
MKLFFQGDVQECIDGIQILSCDFNYELSEKGFKVQVEKSEGSPIYVAKKGDKAIIRYSEKIHFFRGLGLFLEQIIHNKDFEIIEKPQFTTNGVMFDVSQSNAVMRVNTVKDYIKRMAVMGLNMLMLYAEDSYEVKEQPYYGYMRSKYTYDELKECDDFAYIFGIEMIPCVQTLAHLADVLRWQVYWDMRDDDETLLVGEEKTYKFIEDVIAAASRPFRSKRIHIGMDEAWKLGLGEYLQKHGYTKKFDIMNEHLKRVLNIVKKHGLEPMIWSDMYFRAASENGDYYDEKAEITQELADTVPKGVQLVYWDYYHDDEQFYRNFIKLHEKFGSKPIFAGGTWTWNGFSANWGKTFNTTNPALRACKKEGIKEVFNTIWGDNGTESNIYSNLLGLQLFAEHGYAQDLDMEKLRRRFEFCTGCNYDDFVSIKYLDEVPGVEKDNMETYNPSKYLMWQDVLMGLFDENIEGLPLDDHYEKLTNTFRKASQRNGKYGFLFEYLEKVSNVLAIKAEIGIKITEAYKNGDKEALRIFANVQLPELEKRIKDMRQCHKKQWLIINKSIGWDVIDMRYGSILIRIQSAIEQINDYLDGKLERIEELEEVRLSFNGKSGLVPYINFYDWIVSGSRIASHG